MALKHKIDKSDFEKLSADVKKEYLPDGDNFVLDVTGLEDVGPLKRAHDRVKAKAKDLEAKLGEYEAELETYKSDPKSRDIKTLEKSWSEKLTNREKELNGQIDKLSGFVNETLVNSVATTLASEISNAPALMLPHILKRITVDMSGDKPTTKILDKDGKPSALSLEDLKKELLTNADFKPILVANRAKGAGGNPPPTKRADGGNPQEIVNPTKLTPSDLLARIKARKGV